LGGSGPRAPPTSPPATWSAAPAAGTRTRQTSQRRRHRRWRWRPWCRKDARPTSALPLEGPRRATIHWVRVAYRLAFTPLAHHYHFQDALCHQQPSWFAVPLRGSPQTLHSRAGRRSRPSIASPQSQRRLDSRAPRPRRNAHARNHGG